MIINTTMSFGIVTTPNLPATISRGAFLKVRVHLLPGGAIFTDLILSGLVKTDPRQIKSATIDRQFNLLLIITSLCLYILAYMAKSRLNLLCICSGV